MFERQIIRNEDCPRCGAIADIRIDDHQEEGLPPGVVMLALVCPKCKLKRAKGITTDRVLRLEESERRLIQALEAVEGRINAIQQIRARLANVRAKLERARLGI